MKLMLLDWEEFRRAYAPERPMAATIGVFDGLHAGHQALIKKIVDKAPEYIPAVFTFRDNPKRLLRAEGYEGDLLGLDHKLELLTAFGVEVVVLIDFSGDFSRMPGRNFLSTVVERGRVAYMAIGWDFHCGRGRDTDARGLAEFCKDRSVEAELLDPVLFHGDAASSTKIRRAVKAGQLTLAERLLGRPYELELGTFLGGSEGNWRFSFRGGMVRPPEGAWKIMKREGEALLVIDGQGLEVKGLSRAEIGSRIPITTLGKNEEIDKE